MSGERLAGSKDMDLDYGVTEGRQTCQSGHKTTRLGWGRAGVFSYVN